MVMPVFLGVVIYLFDNAYIETLFVTLPGRIMLGTAMFSQFMGWLFIRKIINIEY
jgi:tight adherence protein B